ncbi:MAG: acylphosphatase [Deltaproteobacteria bacterium]
MAKSQKRVHIVVSGLVQGVWYRGSMAREAERIGVAGWVKNLSDGKVEAVVEGSARAVNEILVWCRQGPTAARVDKMETREEKVRGLVVFDVGY